MPSLVRRMLTGVLVFLLWWLVIGRLTILGIAPDIVLLYVAWLGLRHGRQTGSIAGFALGALMDAASGTWGAHMLVKTLVGFLVGFFPATERETLLIQPQQALIGAFVIALLHNGLLVILLALQTDVRNSYMIFGLWLGAAAYTALVGMLATLFIGR